jgi:hypothetical protein
MGSSHWREVLLALEHYFQAWFLLQPKAHFQHRERIGKIQFEPE